MDILKTETPELVGKCNECGMCCRAIMIPTSPELIKTVAEGPDNKWKYAAKFILENWKPITKEAAIKINPFIAEWKGFNYEGKYFYTCKKFNKETNKCGAYDERPETCSGYPWYGRVPSEGFYYAADCGYIIDYENVLKHAAESRPIVIEEVCDVKEVEIEEREKDSE